MYYSDSVTAAVLFEAEANLALKPHGHTIGELENVRFTIGHVQRLNIGRVTEQETIGVTSVT